MLGPSMGQCNAMTILCILFETEKNYFFCTESEKFNSILFFYCCSFSPLSMWHCFVGIEYDIGNMLRSKYSSEPRNVIVSYLRAGGRCPPVHLLVPGLSPSQAFLFLEASIWVWVEDSEVSEVRERPSPPGLRVNPLEPPVRCI